MSAPINYRDLAELSGAIGNSRAAEWFAHSAAEEESVRAEELENADTILAEWEDILSRVSDDAVRGKHTDDCWQRHAPCLARKLLNNGR